MIYLSRDQVRKIDRLALERYHMPGVILMENAARAVADVAVDMLGGNCTGDILIVCGGGNNGGDGLAVARHLHNHCADVSIMLTTDPARYENEALANWKIAEAMNIPIVQMPTNPPRLIIDAIFGTGLTSAPREPFASIVKSLSDFSVPILAVDIPSGLDCDTGQPLGPACIRATRTVTFVANKIGFAKPNAQKYLGEVTVGDIGCPRELIEEAAAENK